MSNDSDRLFDRVLFESDRTCCICRDRARPVKIHHIDGNHSNNERSNLAVLCDPCHTLAHTNIPFSRNLTPEQVRLYDESWRAICTARLLPEVTDRETEEYRQEVLLELSLACHDWKNNYIALQPRDLQNVTGNFKDAWDLLIEAGRHEDSADEWNKYHPVFDESINRVAGNLRSILACHSDVIPAALKTLVIRTIRQLSVERTVYMFFELIAHQAAVRDAIADAVHIEHTIDPDLKSLVAMQSFVYAFNAYKALGHLLPELFHESGAVVLRQLWEVALNLHWIEGDPDNRAQAFCGFTVMENRKLIVKSGNGAELADFDNATAAYQARFRFLDRKGKEQAHSDFAAKNVADRAIKLGEPWKREYELIYHLTSMHTHGAPGAILQSLFLQHYSSPEIRERNSAALLAIVAIRVMVRLVRLLARLGILHADATVEVER